ncbi:hypothetical protein L208DRAFT_1284721 [Tricholoma matsutake]|nr:hypothetical protein L208DRAFT_1284721 [Tricholoma matsutake 945]
MAHMEWKNYWWNIVKRYQVIIKGWPNNIPFWNLCDTSSSLADLETLLQMWHCGTTYWKELTESELQALDLECDKQISNGEMDAPAAHHRCSNHGKKHPQTKHSESDGSND